MNGTPAAGTVWTVWDEYRSRRRAFFWWGVVSHVGLAALLTLSPLAIAGRREASTPVGTGIVAVLAAFVLATYLRYLWQAVRLYSWRCPACGSAFAFSLWNRWRGDRCKRCGVAVGARIPDPRTYPPN